MGVSVVEVEYRLESVIIFIRSLYCIILCLSIGYSISSLQDSLKGSDHSKVYVAVSRYHWICGQLIKIHHSPE